MKRGLENKRDNQITNPLIINSKNLNVTVTQYFVPVFLMVTPLPRRSNKFWTHLAKALLSKSTPLMILTVKFVSHV